MSEMDPSAIAGNQVTTAVEGLSYECYEGAWRGFAPDYRPLPVGRELEWGTYVSITFDAADPGVIKAIYVETPEETIRFAGESALEVEQEEWAVLAQVLGVEPDAFGQPPKIDPDTLTPEEREEWDKNLYSDGHAESLFAYGEAFGRQPAFPVNIDTELAQELYDQAVEKRMASWDQERLWAELEGVGYITGDRDEPRVEVLTRYIDQHPEHREAIRGAVDGSTAYRESWIGPVDSDWRLDPDHRAKLAALQQKLDEVKDEPVTIWEAWGTQKTTLAHVGQMVDVRRVGNEEVILTGRVVGYTDLLGTGGVLQPHPEHGMNYVSGAIRFPQDKDEFAKAMGSYLFRVVK